MEFHTNLFIFSGLAIFMIVAALFAVVSSKIMRAATLLLFVLFLISYIRGTWNPLAKVYTS